MNDTPRPPLTTTTSIWPAAGVLIGAVVMLVVFMLINVIADQGVAPSPTTTPIVVGGLTLATTPSAALRFCNYNETIPTDIQDGFIAPRGTTTQPGAVIPNSGAGDFDCRQPMRTTNATSAQLLSFFNTQLEARGWSLFSQGASNGAPQSLFQKAGSDSFYWVIGVTVTSSAHGDVNWTFRAYQNSETI